MFSSLTTRLTLEVKATKEMVELAEFTRNLFYPEQASAAQITQSEDPWQAIRGRDPGKKIWQIYDHCAALTRLYAIYSTFVEDIATEYLRLLPKLYEKYEELPDAVLKQHRVGFGQILLKLGEYGPYRHLKEVEIFAQLSHGLGGGKPYTLLSDAFFVDRQNYRTDALTKLFGYLGIDKISSVLATHPKMETFLLERIGDTTTFESELNEFIKRRNEAAHSQVEEVIGTAAFITVADFIVVLCEILAEVLTRELHKRGVSLGQYTEIGRITEVFHSGRVAIVCMEPTTISSGDEIIIARGDSIRFVRVDSLQRNGVAADSFTATAGEELGFGLSQKCRVGDSLRRVKIEGIDEPPPPAPGDAGTEELISSVTDEDPETAPSVNEPDTNNLDSGTTGETYPWACPASFFRRRSYPTASTALNFLDLFSDFT